MKNTNLDIRFNKANNILNQFSDSWEDDKLNLLPNFPKIKDMVSNHITQENYLWLITYDLPNDLFDKIDNCLLYTSPSPRDISGSRMPSSA